MTFIHSFVSLKMFKIATKKWQWKGERSPPPLVTGRRTLWRGTVHVENSARRVFLFCFLRLHTHTRANRSLGVGLYCCLCITVVLPSLAGTCVVRCDSNFHPSRRTIYPIWALRRVASPILLAPPSSSAPWFRLFQSHLLPHTYCEFERVLAARPARSGPTCTRRSWLVLLRLRCWGARERRSSTCALPHRSLGGGAGLA